MNELDPMVLAAAGIAIVGVVAIAAGACGGSSKPSKPAAHTKKPSVTSTVAAVSSEEAQKKKKKSKAKKTEAPVEAKPVVASPPVVVAPAKPEPPVPVVAPAAAAVAEKSSKKKSKAKEPAPAKTNSVPAAKPVVPAPLIADDDDDSDDDADTSAIQQAAKKRSQAELEKQKAAAVAKASAALSVSFGVGSTASDSSQLEDWATVKTKAPKVKPVVSAPTSSKVEGSKASAPVVASDSAQSPAVVSAPVVETVTSVTVIDAKKVGVVIGPKGAHKIAIQDKLDVEISLPKNDKDSSEPVTVSVTGSPENVPKAIKAINDLVTKGFSAVIEGDDFRETQVNVPVSSLPDIIGKGGVYIKAIQEQLQVRVVVGPQPEDRNSKANVKVAVSGLKDNVIKAKQVIKGLLQFYYTPVTHPGFEHIDLEIAPQYYNYVIGAKGSEIRHIQANFKVQVHIPSSTNSNTNSNSDEAAASHKGILIVGLPANIEGARKYILKIVDNVEQGRRAASEVNKAWQNETFEQSASASLEEKTSDAAVATSSSSSSTSPSHEVWIEDLLLNAKRVPAGAAGTASAGTSPKASSANSKSAATADTDAAAATSPATSPTGAAPAAAPVAWSSVVLSSNEGW